MGSILGGGGAAAPPPQIPQLEEPEVMPIADPEAQKREQIRKMALAGRRGTSRYNTIIGGDQDTLG